ncbi:MAG TPA: low molecular weight protein arginine phosphatase [Clostridiaceae bacterium]|nr:low molecular weight protein arginine phosphatase [Clostridiaceae bacterium]
MRIEDDIQKHILFVCTGNTCRSPMAAAIFNSYAEKENMNWFAISAGLATESGLPVTPEAKEALAAVGINVEDHRSRQLDEKMIKDARIVLTMTATQRELLHIYYPDKAEKIFTICEYIGSDQDIKDPYGGSLEVYQETAERLISIMPCILKNLTN